jgi:GT2 family glycosyltransferase
VAQRDYREMSATVSVVIVTRNRRNDVTECISSVLKSKYPGKIEVIVVDNGSTDNTESAIRDKFPLVSVSYNRSNLGLVGGRNTGQSRARGEYLLFLDSDTTVDENMIFHLEELASQKAVGIVAPKMYSYLEPKRLWFAGATFNLLNSRANNTGAWEIDTGKYERVTEISHGPTCFIVKRELADLIRGHDPIFLQSYADTDFAFRVKKLGYVNLYCPGAFLYHKTPTLERNASLRGLGMDSPLRAYFYARNKTLFMKRHSPRLNFVAFLIVFLPIINVMYLHRIAKYGGGSKYLHQYLLGVKDGLGFIFKRL